MTEPTPTPQDRLQIQIEDGDPVVFVLSGDLDPHTSPYLQGVIDERLGEDASTAVLDVRAVDFIDSAGLRVFADTHRRLSGAGGTLIVRQPTAALEKLLSVTGLADHVTVDR